MPADATSVLELLSLKSSSLPPTMENLSYRHARELAFNRVCYLVTLRCQAGPSGL